MDIEKVIRRTLGECMDAADKELSGELTADTVLLDCGLDSLDFAVLVSRLEEVLDYDPFTMTDEVVYPRTFGEFVAIYAQQAEHVKHG